MPCRSASQSLNSRTTPPTLAAPSCLRRRFCRAARCIGPWDLTLLFPFLARVSVVRAAAPRPRLQSPGPLRGSGCRARHMPARSRSNLHVRNPSSSRSAAAISPSTPLSAPKCRYHGLTAQRPSRERDRPSARRLAGPAVMPCSNGSAATLGMSPAQAARRGAVLDGPAARPSPAAGRAMSRRLRSKQRLHDKNSVTTHACARKARELLSPKPQIGLVVAVRTPHVWRFVSRKLAPRTGSSPPRQADPGNHGFASEEERSALDSRSTAPPGATPVPGFVEAVGHNTGARLHHKPRPSGGPGTKTHPSHVRPGVAALRSPPADRVIVGRVLGRWGGAQIISPYPRHHYRREDPHASSRCRPAPRMSAFCAQDEQEPRHPTTSISAPRTACFRRHHAECSIAKSAGSGGPPALPARRSACHDQSYS